VEIAEWRLENNVQKLFVLREDLAGCPVERCAAAYDVEFG